MTTTPPPAAGLAQNIAFLAEHADLFAQHADHVTALSAWNYEVEIQVKDESTALDIAVSLAKASVTSVVEPAREMASNGRTAGFTRRATIDGIPVRIASCWTLAQAAA